MSEDLFLRGSGNGEMELSSFSNIEDQLRPSQNKLEPYEKIYVQACLSKAPEIICRGVHVIDKQYEISHPLVDYSGAECVLVRYKQRMRKKRKGSFKEKFGEFGNSKKGFCVVCRGDEYFDFMKHSKVRELLNFLKDDVCTYNHAFGIVLRIPNPEYNGPTTKHKNATYKGMRETLWSDIRRIRISVNTDMPVGIGLV